MFLNQLGKDMHNDKTTDKIKVESPQPFQHPNNLYKKELQNNAFNIVLICLPVTHLNSECTTLGPI